MFALFRFDVLELSGMDGVGAAGVDAERPFDRTLDAGGDMAFGSSTVIEYPEGVTTVAFAPVMVWLFDVPVIFDPEAVGFPRNEGPILELL